jgi:hypothetical protein
MRGILAYELLGEWRTIYSFSHNAATGLDKTTQIDNSRGTAFAFSGLCFSGWQTLSPLKGLGFDSSFLSWPKNFTLQGARLHH